MVVVIESLPKKKKIIGLLTEPSDQISRSSLSQIVCPFFPIEYTEEILIEKSPEF